MKMDNNKKKIGLLAVVLIILAGIVIVGLKGFYVSLMYRSHETINFVAGKEMVVSDVEDLAKEILKDKKFDVRGIEEFEDAVSISTENFTVEEKENLVNKINEKYGLENKVEDVKIQTVSNVRLRDIFTPYFKSTVLVCVFLALYMFIRFKTDDMKKIAAYKAGGYLYPYNEDYDVYIKLSQTGGMNRYELIKKSGSQNVKMSIDCDDLAYD